MLKACLQSFASGSVNLITADPVEMPSGKDAAYENFPVGSVLLPKGLRRHVACFYAFARAADDIADSPDLSPQEKNQRLEGFQNVLLGKGSNDRACQNALNMAESLNDTGVSPQHCLDILAAFRQDAVKSRYDSWSELMAYCRLSAAPVGRYLIDLHGGCRLGYWPSDALCAALQLINHVQDCGDDYRTLGRVYLPGDWMSDAGAVFADLGAAQVSPALRRVLDWMAHGIDTLLLDAGSLSGNLYSSRLGFEASVIFQIARALNSKLKKHDPLSRRIELSKPELLVCSIRGLLSR
ncbi:MAG: squalene synthase HpnC [Rhodospirillaceae bacterium]|nr:squalene synthase HpnC [Rhodospirillaceae bacterium]MBL6929865.1 squalene synthase HpnC [Rhodospirillales bacterium]MBL6941634.1 squalene synthase HpnC [Rhodospirillales bacterium]